MANKKVKLGLRVIDLFSGCGGMSLGFKNAGFKIVAAFDNWQPAIEVYKNNFKDHPIINADLGSLDGDYTMFKKYRPDMIIGGPPCQDFSHAGKRNEDLGRGSLTVIFAEIVANIRPKWVVMENVDRTPTTEKYKKAYAIFKKVGYGVTTKILDASLCGVPQQRKRFFLIGELGGEDNALLYHLMKNQTKKPLTVREYLGNALRTEYYYRHPRNYNRRGVYSVDEPSATIRGVNRPIPPNYPGHSADATHNIEKVRPLTTIERSYIQTFPKTFKFKGTKTNLEQMIGNCVPVKLAEYVANCLCEYIENPPSIPVNLFSRLDKTSVDM